MATQTYRDGLRFVLRWEGGFVDDPDDPGGRTNRGVTQKPYDGWRARQGLPKRSGDPIARIPDLGEVQPWSSGTERRVPSAPPERH